MAKSILGVHHVTAINKNRFKRTHLSKTASPFGLIRTSLRQFFAKFVKLRSCVNYTTSNTFNFSYFRLVLDLHLVDKSSLKNRMFRIHRSQNAEVVFTISGQARRRAYRRVGNTHRRGREGPPHHSRPERYDFQ